MYVFPNSGWVTESVQSLGELPVMLVGGINKYEKGARGTDNELMAPSFFSLNDATNPLPDCLKGTENEIDGNARRMPALIKTEGRTKI